MSQPTALQPSHFIIICTFAVAIGHFVLCSFYSLHYLLHLCLVWLSSPKIIEYLWSSRMAWFDWSMQNKNYPLFLSICDNKKAIPKLWWIKSDLQKQDCDADPILHTSQEFALLLEQKGSKCRERDKGRHREKKKTCISLVLFKIQDISKYFSRSNGGNARIIAANFGYSKIHHFESTSDKCNEKPKDKDNGSHLPKKV